MRFSFNQLERLFSMHHRSLYVSALSITKDSAAAEDAVHDALLAVSDIKIRPDDLKAYLFKVVRNKALMHVKQRAKFVEGELATDFIDSGSLNSENKLFVRQVLKEIEALDKDTQQIILLKLFSGLAFREIAEITGSSENTVASKYRRGIVKLQEKLNEY